MTITHEYDTAFMNHTIDIPITLNNWCIVRRPHPWRAPEQIPLSVQGTRSTDGKTVVTSHIVSHTKGRVVTASGTCYVLGTVNDEYAKQFPQWKDWV